MQRAGDDLGEAAGGDVLGLVLGIGADGASRVSPWLETPPPMQMISGSKVLMTLAMPTPTYSIQLSTTLLATASPLAAASKESLALT